MYFFSEQFLGKSYIFKNLHDEIFREFSSLSCSIIFVLKQSLSVRRKRTFFIFLFFMIYKRKMYYFVIFKILIWFYDSWMYLCIYIFLTVNNHTIVQIIYVFCSRLQTMVSTSCTYFTSYVTMKKKWNFKKFLWLNMLC